MAGLANILEDLRNRAGVEAWRQGKDIERIAKGDPDAAATLEQLMGLAGGGHALGGGSFAGGMAGMLTKKGTYEYPVKPMQVGAHELPEHYVGWGREIDENTDEPYVLIHSLSVPKHLRGQGYGRLSMRKALSEIQDAYPDLPIRMAADQVENSTDLRRLVNFYQHEGFDVIDGSGPSVIMEHDGIRRPVVTYKRPRRGYYEED